MQGAASMHGCCAESTHASHIMTYFAVEARSQDIISTNTGHGCPRRCHRGGAGAAGHRMGGAGEAAGAPGRLAGAHGC